MLGRLIATLFGRTRGEAPSAIGPLDAYFDKIAQLEEDGQESFFVTAKETTGDRFVQVSAGKTRDGSFEYLFDLPLVAWSEPHAKPIEAEAHRHGLPTTRSSNAGMKFLDIEITSRDAHEDFARLVVTRIFGIPESAEFEITWG